MNKLKEALIQFVHTNPSLFPNPNSYPTLIQQHFSQFFPDFHTPPNHPPYAAMIHRAIWELKEKGGSREESISKYIKQEYVDLPWAHSTLLKHHLEKLCYRKEICVTPNQCYFVAGADFEPLSPSASEKQLKRKKTSESGKKISGARKRLKKQKNRQDIKSKKQIIEVCQEQEQVVQPLDQVTDEQEKQEARHLKIKDQTYEQGICLIDVYINQDMEEGDVCANATEEIPSENLLIDHVDVADNENQSVEQPNDKKQIEICGTKNRKRKQNVESKRRCSKGIKNNEEPQVQVLSEASMKQDDEVTDGESHELKRIIEVNTGDLQIQEEELHPDNSGYSNIEQIQMKKNPEILQKEDSPSSDPVLHKSAKRRWTRSQIKTSLEKDALASTNLSESPGYANMPKEKLDVVEYLSEEKEQAMETIKWKEETKQTQSVVSTQMNGQRSKLRSSQKKTAHLESLDSQNESLETPSIEPLNPICTALSPQLPDLDEPKQVQEPKDRPEEDKPKYKGRGRHPKKGQKSAKDCKVGSRRHKPKWAKGEVLGKSKTTNKIDQLKHKRHGMHKMARRSGSKKSNTSR